MHLSSKRPPLQDLTLTLTHRKKCMNAVHANCKGLAQFMHQRFESSYLRVSFLKDKVNVRMVLLLWLLMLWSLGAQAQDTLEGQERNSLATQSDALLIAPLSPGPNPNFSTELLDIEFLPSRPELTPHAQLSIKRFLSKHRLLQDKFRVQELKASIEEDGSYLENLCQARLKVLEGFLLQAGLEGPALLGHCPLAQLSSNSKTSSPSSTLRVIFAPIAVQIKPKGTRLASAASQKELASGLHYPPAAPDRAAHSDPLRLKAERQTPFSDQLTKEEETRPASLNCMSRDQGTCEEVQAGSNTPAQIAPKWIVKGSLVHLALGDLARSEGWTFIWYPKFSWKAVADISLSIYPNAELAVAEVVDLLRLEGKPLQLRVSEGNKVMEIMSTEVSHE